MLRRLALAVAGVLVCAASAHAAAVFVAVQDNTFSPPVITAASGDSIVWTNTGLALHTVTSTKPAPPGRVFDQTLAPGQTFVWIVPRLTRTARLPYQCNFHVVLGMKGAINLTP